MKYNDKWAISEYEPKTDVLWVKPAKNEGVSINAFVNGKWQSVEGGGDNTVVFKVTSISGDKIIQEIQGTLPTDYTDIPKTRFVYSDGTNIVPLSISYTGSITASGMFVPYNETTPKFLYFTSAYQESSIIGTEVHIASFDTAVTTTVSQEPQETTE